MAHQVFISYASNDLLSAEKIYHALTAKNIRCWLDRRDIHPGDKWPKELAAALEQVKVVILVFSAHTNQSEWVEREINHALNKKKTIIVFRVKDVPPQGVFDLLKSNYQWLDAFTPPLQDHIDRLAAAVQEHLKITPVPPSRGLLSNPFTESIAIQDPARFIGRAAELRRLLDLLQGGSVSLQGEPKIGKSSLLRHLARNWQGQVIGPLDCHSLQDRDDFYEQLAEALALGNHSWKSIRKALNKSNVLFLLDELDVAPGCGITYADLALFRSICEKNQGFKMVTVTRTPLKEVFPDTGRGSPAFNFLVPFTVGAFNEGDARQLLTHPWAPGAPLFDADTCEKLLALTGRHPYKLQRAAYYRFESLADPAYDWQAGYREEME